MCLPSLFFLFLIPSKNILYYILLPTYSDLLSWLYLIVDINAIGQHPQILRNDFNEDQGNRTAYNVEHLNYIVAAGGDQVTKYVNKGERLEVEDTGHHA